MNDLNTHHNIKLAVLLQTMIHIGILVVWSQIRPPWEHGEVVWFVAWIIGICLFIGIAIHYNKHPARKRKEAYEREQNER